MLNSINYTMPDFLQDIKDENWGMLNGRMVMFDYAMIDILKLRSDYTLVKPNW